MPRLSHLLASLLLAACHTGSTSDNDDTDTDVTHDVDGPSLVGVWRALDSGGPLDTWNTGVISHLEFVGADASGGEGTVRVFGADPTSGVQACPQALYARAAEGSLLLSSTNVFSGTRVLLVAFDGADALALTDESGIVQSFERVAEVASDAVCGALTVHEDHVFDLSPSNWSNLLFDGTNVLLPTYEKEFYPITNLATGSYGVALDYGSTYANLLTTQGTDGWGHCACGGDNEVVRTALGGAQVDMVSSTDLGVEISVKAAAWDQTNLWITGHDYPNNVDMLLQVDAASEPDVLVSQTPLFVYFEQMVAGGDGLYGLTQSGIVRLDTTTGKAAATWSLPPELGTSYWRGLTTNGTDFFLMGTQDSGGVRVVRVSLE